MPFELKALVAEKRVLEKLAKDIGSAVITELVERVSLLPITADFEDEFTGEAAPGGTPFTGLGLSAFLAEKAKEASKEGTLAYIEADYKPGTDHQGAVIWQSGVLYSGPLVDDTGWDPRESPLQDRPVNHALRLLGVEPGRDGDEWDAAGINRCPATEDWTKEE